MFRFSLKSLFVAVTLAAIASFVLYFLTRDHFLICRLDCGNARRIELLAPNRFCDQGEPVYYRFSGMASGEPIYFSVWGCGSNRTPKLFRAENGNLIGVATFWPDQLDIIVDFKARLSWPPRADHGNAREVNDEVRNMLERLPRENGQLWLSNTYDGELEKPEFPWSY